jgi:hypothetical protein
MTRLVTINPSALSGSDARERTDWRFRGPLVSRLSGEFRISTLVRGNPTQSKRCLRRLSASVCTRFCRDICGALRFVSALAKNWSDGA